MSYLDQLDTCPDKLRAIQETIIANIVFLGQIPAPTFHEKERAIKFLDRLVDSGVDECTTDGYQNPVGIIRGRDSNREPIIVVAHLDTHYGRDVDHNFTITHNMIKGPGVLDNSVGIGTIASLPLIFRHLDLRFNSDIILAGVIQSLGRGNLRGIRHLVKTWPSKIRAAVCIEGGELGRLNYYSNGMTRCEIKCTISEHGGIEHRFRPNAILVLHEVIDQILEIRLPQKPRSRVIIGKIYGGHKHGTIAYEATLGLEIQSDTDRMVKALLNDIRDIVTGIGHEFGVELELKTISSVHAARLKYNHPLVKAADEIMHRLDIPIIGEPSESEVSIFLAKKIPAVTLGLTHGTNYHQPNAKMEIEPMFKGIAQIIGTIQAIDSGVSDE
jgi:acetylornithine deacetylase/succinyl-diaminopimelate desuccinylase-like protein